MSSLKKFVVASAVALGVVAATTVAVTPSVARADHHEGDKAKKNIVDTAVAAGQFKTLAAALQAGGLVETLKGEGPFTVFAPTDEAFAKIPKATLEDLLKPENKEKLVAILKYHVVSGKVMAKDVMGLEKAKTVNGKEVKVKTKDGKVMIDDATVAKADVAASNGVIHVIDTVLMP
jgi:transforming growth factor-beta-induced protein